MAKKAITSRDIGSSYHELDKEEGKIKKKKLKRRTECPHKTGKKATIEFKGGRFICTACGDEISFDPVTEQEFNNAVTVINNVANKVKLASDLNKDADIIEAVGDIQFSVQDTLYGAFKRVNQMNNKNKDGGYRGDRDDVTIS